MRLTDVAADAGVSSALASRVLNDDPGARATDATKARIVEAARRLGYVPNVAARALRSSSTGLVGLVVHDLSSPIYLELMRGAREEAARRGRFLVLGDIDELLRDDDAFQILVRGRRVDGLIVQGGHGAFDERLADVAAVLPTVVVNAPARLSSGDLAAVYPDEIAASRLLAEHLVSLGHERIGLISGPRDSITSQLRLAGMEAALEGAGLVLADDDRVHGDWSADAGREGLATLMTRWRDGPRPTALVAGNALIAMGVLGAADALGLVVPDDLSIAAVHETWIAAHLTPSLTSVSLPLHEVGALAVRRLLDGDPRGGDAVVSEPPPELHARRSTAPPRG